MKMVGLKGKPFCGQHCSHFPQGSGRSHKRIGKHIEKRREERAWRREMEQG